MNEYNGWMMEKITRIHQEEMLHNAELYRMEKLALSGLPRKPALTGRILYQLGCWMAAWGTRLEKRYCFTVDCSPVVAGNRR